MRILVTYGSKRGGTEGIARMLAYALAAAGADTEVLAANQVTDLDGYDAVIVGGALYAFWWHRHARRFIRKWADELRSKPVWCFSSGPLDDSASRQEIPPIPQVSALMARVGARGHATFGGRLLPDTRGFMARAMTNKLSGDWRDPARINRWAAEIAVALGLHAPETEEEPVQPHV